MKRVLILGATGAMGKYLVPLLAERGWQVDAVALEEFPATPNVRSVLCDAKKDLDSLLTDHYNAIVDFMLYLPHELEERVERLLAATDHYIFLSSYRVYGNEESPVRETSPRLLECSKDADYLAQRDTDYGLYKAVEEDILQKASRKNWTIVRPTMVYSHLRYQLVCLEAPAHIYLWRNGYAVRLPEAAKQFHAAMTWSGDIAKMLAGLLLNPQAYGEAFTLGTAESVPWEEVAAVYQRVLGMKIEWCSMDFFEALYRERQGEWNKLRYDRLYDRRIDNRKILSVAGLRQEDLTPLAVGLERELRKLPADAFTAPEKTSAAMIKLMEGE